jgi:hypothetical protein
MTFQNKNTHLSRSRTQRQTPKETINSGSAESSIATPPIDTIADEEEIVTAKNSSVQHSKSSGTEKEKEKKATQSQEESREHKRKIKEW